MKGLLSFSDSPRICPLVTLPVSTLHLTQALILQHRLSIFLEKYNSLIPHHRQISGSYFSVIPSSVATCTQSESKNVSHSVIPHSLDCSLSGSSVHGILQERILEWVAIPFARGSSQGIESGFPALQADSLASELPGKPQFPLCTYLLQISLSKQFSPRSQGKEYCAQ